MNRLLILAGFLFLLWRLCWWSAKQEYGKEEFEILVLQYRAWKRNLKRYFFGNWI